MNASQLLMAGQAGIEPEVISRAVTKSSDGTPARQSNGIPFGQVDLKAA